MKLPAALLTAAGLVFAQDADTVCRKAVELHRAGDMQAAAVQYEACLAAKPEAGPLRSNYGAVLAALGRYEEAISQYERSLKSAPGDPRLRFNLALAYYKSGAIARARDQFHQLHGEQPQAIQITLLLADCLLQLGDMQPVVDLLSPYESEQKDNLAFSYLLGMALIRSGQIEKGQKVVDRILRDGNSAEAHLLIAHAAFTKRDYPQAVSEFGKALEVNGSLPGVQSFYGQSLLYTGDADGAAAAFRKALEATPTDYEANVKLGSILAVRKQYTDALSFLERAARLRPDSVEAHAELAAVFKALGRKSEADREAARVRDLGGTSDAQPETGLLPNGTIAPDFLLPAPESKAAISLRSLDKQMPVVLVFGSYTCPKFRGDAEALNRLSQRYKGRVQFVLVYVHEAHSDADWQSTINQRDQVALAPARTLAEKKSYAASCTRRLHIPYSVAVDDLDRKVEKAYNAWPSAVYLIDQSGVVRGSSRLGEQDFRSEQFEIAIQRLFSR